jgi:hypothetical protein
MTNCTALCAMSGNGRALLRVTTFAKEIFHKLGNESPNTCDLTSSSSQQPFKPDMQRFRASSVVYKRFL